MSDGTAHERVGDAALEQAYRSDRRHAPWLFVNMVTSIDGATTVEGRSSTLGDSQDLIVFRVLRAAADLVLVAASTARAEHYKKPKLPDHLRSDRAERGQTEVPRVALVTGSLEFDIELFEDAPPIVITTEDSPIDRRKALAERTDVIVCGDSHVDMRKAISRLNEMGYGLILSEGGPSLNAQLATDDLIDEICVTIAPVLVSGDSKRILDGAEPLPGGQTYRLARVTVGATSMFTRWMRER